MEKLYLHTVPTIEKSTAENSLMLEHATCFLHPLRKMSNSVPFLFISAYVKFETSETPIINPVLGVTLHLCYLLCNLSQFVFTVECLLRFLQQPTFLLQMNMLSMSAPFMLDYMDHKYTVYNLFSL